MDDVMLDWDDRMFNRDHFMVDWDNLMMDWDNLMMDWLSVSYCLMVVMAYFRMELFMNNLLMMGDDDSLFVMRNEVLTFLVVAVEIVLIFKPVLIRV